MLLGWQLQLQLRQRGSQPFGLPCVAGATTQGSTCLVVWHGLAFLQRLFARQLLCLFQGSGCAFSKAAVGPFSRQLLYRGSLTFTQGSCCCFSHPNPSCRRAPMGFEQKMAAVTHKSYHAQSRTCHNPCKPAAHKKKRKQDRKDKGTAENSGRVRESREDNTTNNIKGKPRGQTAEAAGQPFKGYKLKFVDMVHLIDILWLYIYIIIPCIDMFF